MKGVRLDDGDEHVVLVLSKDDMNGLVKLHQMEGQLVQDVCHEAGFSPDEIRIRNILPLELMRLAASLILDKERIA